MRFIILLILILIGVVACHRPLKNPENSDLVYLDIKKDAEKSLQKVRSLQTDVLKAKDDYEKAPIRTGQRADALEDYFLLVKKLEKEESHYLYLVNALQLRLETVRREYPEYYEAKKTWPNEEEYHDHLVEKRLKSAPKEWSAERRIKARALSKTGH